MKNTPNNPSAYLNMAGAGRLSDAVLARVTDYQRIEGIIGAYDAEELHQETIEGSVYTNLSRFLGCHSKDIALFENATRAWVEIVSRIPLKGAEVILTTPYEYAGNLQILQTLAQRHNLELKVIPCDTDGDVDLEWLEKTMSARVGLISIVQVPSSCGIVNPMEEIGKIVKPYPAAYIVDACQAVGQVPVSTEVFGCDALTGAGRKFLCGPRGTGFAFVSKSLRERFRSGFVDLHMSDFLVDGQLKKDLSSARFLEMAERNCAAIYGLSLAIEEAIPSNQNQENIDAFRQLRTEIPMISGVIPIDPGTFRSSIFTFRHERVNAAEIAEKLKQRGIYAWRIKGSHTPLQMLSRKHNEAVRLSSDRLSHIEAETTIKALHSILA